jgi:hypothetical protein
MENAGSVGWMTEERPLPYRELSWVAERILEEGEDDPEALARALDRLDPAVRDELLDSDFLNAWQVFYYHFREDPGELERDRLTLQPASALADGILITEIEFYELVFLIEAKEPVISVRTGGEIAANFRGKDAYRRARQFLDDAL